MTIFRLVCCLAVALLACGCGKYEIRSREVGFKGAARANPYLAAERLLDASGIDARTGASWAGSLDPVGTLVVPASFLNSRMRIQQVDSWVRDGGHLIILRERGESFWNDFAKRAGGDVEEANNNLATWLEETLGVVEREESEDVGDRAVAIDAESFELAVATDRVFDLTFERYPGEFGDADSEEEAAEGHQLLSLVLDDGRITLLAEAQPFRNRYIGDEDHAALLLALVGLSPSGPVVFVYGGGVSFFQMLWERGWAGLLGIAAVLVIWLWRNLPRFGPAARSAPDTVHSGYLRHVEAVGDFLWRNGRALTLLEPLRREIMDAFEHHKAGALDADIFEWLGQRAGIPRERVMRAMTDTGRPDGPTFLRMTADLQQIKTSL